MLEKESETAITSDEKMKYYLMTAEEALKEMTKTAKEVNEILGLSSTTLVRLILNHFNWDKNTLTGIRIKKKIVLLIDFFRSILRRSRKAI